MTFSLIGSDSENIENLMQWIISWITVCELPMYISILTIQVYFVWVDADSDSVYLSGSAHMIIYKLSWLFPDILLTKFRFFLTDEQQNRILYGFHHPSQPSVCLVYKFCRQFLNDKK